MTEALSSLGLEFEFFDAVDGTSGSIELLPWESFSPWTTLLMRNLPLQLPEAGCFLSHLRLWQEERDKGTKYLLVLEDDAVLNANLPAILSAWRGLADQIDLLRIYACYCGESKTSSSSPEASLVNCGYLPGTRYLVLEQNRLLNIPGTVAYLVNARAIKTLASFADKKVTMPIDSFLETMRVKRGLRHFILHPSPVHLNVDLPSDIDADRKKQRPDQSNTGQKWRQLWFFRFTRLAYYARAFASDIRAADELIELCKTSRSWLPEQGSNLRQAD